MQGGFLDPQQKAKGAGRNLVRSSRLPQWRLGRCDRVRLPRALVESSEYILDWNRAKNRAWKKCDLLHVVLTHAVFV